MIGTNDQNKTIKSLSLLGEAMVKWGRNEPKESFNKFLAEPYFDQMNTTIQREHHYNGWFTEDNVRQSLLNLGLLLTEDNLKDWVSKYTSKGRPKKVGLIMAGNIPLVGFHDFISTLLAGHIAVVKLSSDDKHLLPVLISVLVELQPELNERIQVVEKLNSVEAVIATGSNNSARYFEKYFGHLPNIIRKNRTSLAVLTGEESEDELIALGKDIFTYYGLGCRNVSHLMLPTDFDLNRIFGAIIDFSDIINHNKYANNYDYYKAIYLMNREEIIENGFVLTRASDELFAPIAVLHYQRYEDQEQLSAYLTEHREEIQAIVGKEYIPFGKAQFPSLDDYADGIDTMAFLSQL